MAREGTFDLILLDLHTRDLTGLAKIVGVAGVILAGILIVIAHRRRPELLASDVSLSVYFTDPTRSVMTSAYAAIAAALMSVSFLLALKMEFASLMAAVTCCIGCALLIPIVATTQRKATIVRSDAIRRAHRYAAAAAFASIGLAMAFSAFGAILKSNDVVAIFGASGAMSVSLVLIGGTRPKHGLRQKLFLVVLGLWVAAITMTR